MSLQRKMSFVPRLVLFLAIVAIVSSTNGDERNLNDTPGMQRCLSDKIFSERVEIGTKCVCRNDDDGIALVCSDECAFCNRDRSVCGMKAEEALYDIDSGLKIGIGQVFEYLKLGPMDIQMFGDQREFPHNDGIVLGIEELDCEEEDTGDEYILGKCANCNVYFDGIKCDSCKVTECGRAGSGVFAPVIDCTNLQKDAIYDFCSDVQIEDSGLFQAFLPDQFQKCLPMENLMLQEQ